MQKKGDLAAAEPLYREALEARREILGNRHPSTLGSINNLGALLQDKGDLAAAEPLTARRCGGAARHRWHSAFAHAPHQEAPQSRLLKAKVAPRATLPPLRVRRYCQSLTDAWRSNIETLGHLHPDTLSSRTNLGALLQKMDDLTVTERAEPSGTNLCSRC